MNRLKVEIEMKTVATARKTYIPEHSALTIRKIESNCRTPDPWIRRSRRHRKLEDFKVY